MTGEIHRGYQYLVKELGTALGYSSYMEYNIGRYFVDNYWERGGQQIVIEITESNLPNSEKRGTLRQMGYHVITLTPRKFVRQEKQAAVEDFNRALHLYYKRGVSISEIARVIGRNQSTVFGWVKGGSRPRLMNKAAARNLRKMFQ